MFVGIKAIINELVAWAKGELGFTGNGISGEKAEQNLCPSSLQGASPPQPHLQP